ncbi:hypothetical protein H4219_000421 [Mycoemilia scoparia]|uniref:Transcription initiation factor TFIID subunit 10 n=1 Tax=Mycoemilia scoparia TaxID=417184 RepID=A0A9W8DX97_9FUNG|nr:hypothetical protein H4219_000421 [Mycoemilia scoparia]
MDNKDSMDIESPVEQITQSNDSVATKDHAGTSEQAASTSDQPPNNIESSLDPKDMEYVKKEKSLAEFLVQMDQYSPIIPDALTDYYLSQAGFECDDVRIKKLLAMATQKFISDDRKTVLTMDDLAAALSEYGVKVKKPDYFM